MISNLFRSSVHLRRFSAACFAASVLSLAIVPDCYGQFGTGGGTGGGFGGTGGGGFGGGGGGFGGGGGGGGGAGGFGAGGNGVVQPEVINVGGETRYIRDQRPAGSFVGADSSDYYRSGAVGAAGGLGGAGGLATQQLGGLGPRGAATQGGIGGVGGVGGVGGQGVGGQGQGQGANTILRRNYRIGFEYPSLPANQVATINTRVGQLDSIRAVQQRSGRQTGGLARVQVSRQNGRVVLTGSVSTMEDRALAERLVRLEPNVFQVQNELTVEGTGSEDIQSSRFDDEFPPDEGGYQQLPLDEEEPLPTPEPAPTQEEIPTPGPLRLNPIQLNPLQLDP